MPVIGTCNIWTAVLACQKLIMDDRKNHSQCLVWKNTLKSVKPFSKLVELTAGLPWSMTLQRYRNVCIFVNVFCKLACKWNMPISITNKIHHIPPHSIIFSLRYNFTCDLLQPTNAAWYGFSHSCLCVYVWTAQTCESTDLENSFLVCSLQVHLYVKLYIGSRSKPQEQKIFFVMHISWWQEGYCVTTSYVRGWSAFNWKAVSLLIYY